MKEIGLQASGVTGEDDNQHEYNSTDELTPTQPLALDDESSLDSPPEPSWGYLETLTGYFDSFELRQAEFKFGRDPKGSSYFLQEARVPRGIWLALSRSHFSIEKNTDLSDLHSSEIILRDFSTYGTFVNGEKVGKGKWRPLVNCDIISICAVENRIFR